MYLLIDVKAGPFDEQCEKEKWKRVDGDTRSYLLPNSHDAHLPARIGDRIAVFMGSECYKLSKLVSELRMHFPRRIQFFISKA